MEETFKLIFDTKLNHVSQKYYIDAELFPQIEPSFINSIATLQQQILGAIAGFIIDNFAGFEIKVRDTILFAGIKN